MKLSADWMKLDVNIFSHPKIRRIRRLPDGDAIFTLWIYLLCEGMKNSDNPGVIEMTAGVPCNEEDLAEDTKIKIDTIRLGVKSFLDLGMIIIEPNNNGAMSIKNIRKHQSIDELEYKRALNRERVRNFREKKKLIAIENKVKDVMHYSNDSNGQSRVDKRREEKNRIDKIDFNLFWDSYDKKVGKKSKIESKWYKLSKQTQQQILDHISIYKQNQPDKQYRKNPETYLNNETWLDEIITTSSTNPLYNKIKCTYKSFTDGEAKKLESCLASDPDAIAKIEPKSETYHRNVINMNGGV